MAQVYKIFTSIDNTMINISFIVNYGNEKKNLKDNKIIRKSKGINQ